MIKPNKQIYIDFILNELEKGNIQYKEVCSVFCGNFRLTENSFIKYWKLANTAHKERITERNNILEEERIELNKGLLKTNILNKQQALEILSNIAVSESSKDPDKINAVKTLATFEGWEAPKETKNTNINIETPIINFIDGD